MSAKDGGPAFPTLTQVEKYDGVRRSTAGTMPTYKISTELAKGMSLRDYFAGQVAQGGADAICDEMDPECPWRDPERPRSDEEVAHHAERHARAAYLLADAMLLERAKAEGGGQ